MWTGQRALQRGLVDVLGGLPTAIAVAKQAAGIAQVGAGDSRTARCSAPALAADALSQALLPRMPTRKGELDHLTYVSRS